MTEKINDIHRYTNYLQDYQIAQLNLITDWLKELNVKKILDAGCGPGILTQSLKDKYDWTGVDISPVVNEFHGKGIMSSLDSLPFENDSFDVTLCVDVLEHLTDEVFRKSIKELSRVTKKALIIIVPNEPSLQTLSLVCPNCGTEFHSSGHIRNVSKEDLFNFLQPAGYKLDSEVQVGDKFPDSDSIRELLFIKRFYEQSLYYNFECPSCEMMFSDYYNNIPKTDVLNAVYNSIKIDWFNELSGATLQLSEKCFLWVKEEFSTQYHESFDSQLNNYYPQKTRVAKIEPGISHCFLESAYVLPFSSYLVTQSKEIIEKSRNLKSIDLPEGIYHLFFATKVGGIKFDGTAINPFIFILKWKDQTGWNILEKSYEKNEKINEEITLEKSPEVGLEGTYVQLIINSQENEDFNREILVSLLGIEAFQKDSLSGYKDSTATNKTKDLLLTWNLKIINNLIHQNSSIHTKIQDLENENYSNLKELENELKRNKDLINNKEEIIKSVYTNFEELEKEIERKNEKIINYENLLKDYYSTIQDLEKGTNVAFLSKKFILIKRMIPNNIKNFIKKFL